MHTPRTSILHSACAVFFSALLLSSLTACDADRDGAAIDARAQTISFSTAPALNIHDTATVSATASSGLSVQYRTTTSSVCTVNSTTGLVTSLMPGSCTIAANQSGNSTYMPAAEVMQSLDTVYDANQIISFSAAPALTLYSTATVSATASSGLAVSYSSLTSGICTLNSSTGLVTTLALGECIIAADQAGDAYYIVAPQVTQTITVAAPVGMTVPGVPAAVAATAGDNATTVQVSFGATDSGGSAITAYTVTSTPASFTATGSSSPVTVNCSATCAGYAFSVTASNAIGVGNPSAPAEVITVYNVVERFYEPDTQPRDSIFIGSFTYNATTRSVSNLQGILSESMTGELIAYPDDNMTWLTLDNQLSSVYDAVLGGLLVTTFLNDTTNTFYGGTWTPEDGITYGGIYDGWPGTNPGNAYAMVFINTENPLAALTQAQIDRLAYADCAPGGMMGAVCMTGTSVAGYGSVGTMSGYPVAQEITRAP